MVPPLYSFLKHNNNIIYLKLFMILFMSCIPDRTNLLCSNQLLANPANPHHLDPSDSNTNTPLCSLATLTLDGYFTFQNNHHAAMDFGNTHHFLPLAVLHPKSASDISSTIKHVYNMGSGSGLTVAARGHGHSLQGQAQAHQGIVINMESLEESEMQVYSGDLPYVDVSGGKLWIDVLHETLRYGLAPKSWTDYLHLTVGGTLSYAGISGQAFRHGPQIDNVYQLEVVTGMLEENPSFLISKHKFLPYCFNSRCSKRSRHVHI